MTGFVFYVQHATALNFFTSICRYSTAVLPVLTLHFESSLSVLRHQGRWYRQGWCCGSAGC